MFGGLRLAVCVWRYAFGGLAVHGFRLAVDGLRLAVGGLSLPVGGLRSAGVWRLAV